MNGGTPRPPEGDAASDGFSGLNQILACGCLHGGARHECGVGEEPRASCSRRCQSLTIDELRRIGASYGGCLCSPVPWVVAS